MTIETYDGNQSRNFEPAALEDRYRQELAERQLANIQKELYEEHCKSDPSISTCPDSSEQLANLSPGDYVAVPNDPSAAADLHAAYVHALQDLTKLDKNSLSPSDTLTAEHTLHEVTWRSQSLRLGNIMPVNADWSSIQNRILIEASGHGNQQFNTPRQYRDYLGRLQQVPHVFSMITDQLRSLASIGDTVPIDVMEEVEKQLTGILNSTPPAGNFTPPPHQPNSAFYPAFIEFQDVIFEQVLPAYESLRDFLRREYLPKCHPSPLANSRHAERYELGLRYHTDDETMTPDKANDMIEGWLEAAEIEVRSVAQDMGIQTNKLNLRGIVEEIMGRGHLSGILPREVTSEAIGRKFRLCQQAMHCYLTPLFPAESRDILERFPLEIRMDDGVLAASSFARYWRPNPSSDRLGVHTEPFSNEIPYASLGVPRRIEHEGDFGHHMHFMMKVTNPDASDYHRFVSLNTLGCEMYALYVEWLCASQGIMQRHPWSRADRALVMLHEARVAKLCHLWNNKGVNDSQLRQEQYSRGGWRARERSRVKRDPSQYFSYAKGRERAMALYTKAEQYLGPTALKFALPQFHRILLRSNMAAPSIVEKHLDMGLPKIAAQLGQTHI